LEENKMHLETWNLLDIFVVIVTLAATVILYIANKRFLSKEFKKITNWVVITSGMFFIAQLPMVLSIFFPISTEKLYTLMVTLNILVGFCFIKTAYEINKFSKVFGFAKSEKFTEVFIKGIKKKGGV
jgi:hypothetical protein